MSSISEFQPLLENYDLTKIDYYLNKWAEKPQFLCLVHESPTSEKHMTFDCPFCGNRHNHGLTPIGNIGPREPHCHHENAPWTINKSQYILIRVTDDEYRKYWVPFYFRELKRIHIKNSEYSCWMKFSKNQPKHHIIITFKDDSFIYLTIFDYWEFEDWFYFQKGKSSGFKFEKERIKSIKERIKIIYRNGIEYWI